MQTQRVRPVPEAPLAVVIVADHLRRVPGEVVGAAAGDGPDPARTLARNTRLDSNPAKLGLVEAHEPARPCRVWKYATDVRGVVCHPARTARLRGVRRDRVTGSPPRWSPAPPARRTRPLGLFFDELDVQRRGAGALESDRSERTIGSTRVAKCSAACDLPKHRILLPRHDRRSRTQDGCVTHRCDDVADHRRSGRRDGRYAAHRSVAAHCPAATCR